MTQLNYIASEKNINGKNLKENRYIYRILLFFFDLMIEMFKSLAVIS